MWGLRLSLGLLLAMGATSLPLGWPSSPRHDLPREEMTAGNVKHKATGQGASTPKVLISGAHR